MVTKNTTICPKCKYRSGDDWNQCKGSCPMPMSPHYDPQAKTPNHGLVTQLRDQHSDRPA